MSEEEIDIDHYSKVLKKQARNESDKIKDIKRSIEDNETIKQELDQEAFNIVITTLQNEIDNLEKMASQSEKFLEEKLNEDN